MRTINLCGRRGRCCPMAYEIEQDKYLVIDDDGGESILTRENIEILYKTTGES